jgi:hypothetical protein
LPGARRYPSDLARGRGMALRRSHKVVAVGAAAVRRPHRLIDKILVNCDHLQF